MGKRKPLPSPRFVVRVTDSAQGVVVCGLLARRATLTHVTFVDGPSAEGKYKLIISVPSSKLRAGMVLMGLLSDYSAVFPSCKFSVSPAIHSKAKRKMPKGAKPRKRA